MATVNRLFSRVLLASLATLVVGVGCYNPKITSGKLQCNREYLPECPDGFTCVDKRCVKIGNDASAPDRSEAKIDTQIDKPVVEVMSEVPPVVDMGMCFAPVTGCTPASGTCDPQCQTGCGCRQKCSVNNGGALTCNALGQGAVKQEGAGCSIAGDGATQADNCEPGLVCVMETCAPLCERFCRTNADCPSGLCNRALPGGFKTCAFPVSDCNPVKAAGDPACPGAIQGCYLSATVKDRKVCDCSTASLPRDASCSASTDCLVGLVCADSGGSGLDLRCRIACSMTPIPNVANGGCPVGYTCRPHLDSLKNGFCN